MPLYHPCRALICRQAGATDGVLGLDRNVGQATDSQGSVYCITNMALLEIKIRRTQHLQGCKYGGSVRLGHGGRARYPRQGQVGLHRSILVANWGHLEQLWTYKYSPLIKVNPAYTSQTNHKRGWLDKQNRTTRSRIPLCGL